MPLGRIGDDLRLGRVQDDLVLAARFPEAAVPGESSATPRLPRGSVPTSSRDPGAARGWKGPRRSGCRSPARAPRAERGPSRTGCSGSTTDGPRRSRPLRRRPWRGATRPRRPSRRSARSRPRRQRRRTPASGSPPTARSASASTGSRAGRSPNRRREHAAPAVLADPGPHVEPSSARSDGQGRREVRGHSR